MSNTFFDIQFDPVAREIVLTAPLGSASMDMVTTVNPSVQNGAILQYSRCTNLVYPMFGIGMEQVFGSDMSILAFEMNRWKTQAKQDGATLAKWTSSILSGINNFLVAIQISYL